MSQAARKLNEDGTIDPKLHFEALWANNIDADPNQYEQMECQIRDTQIEELSDGAVIVESHYSSLNYKDALAITGQGKILRHLPLVPGIDVSGVVAQSSDPRFSAGDNVLMTGCGLGETATGGLSQLVRTSGKELIKLPAGLTLREAMILGTAGFTAGLALNQLEHNGLSPEKGEVLVTGATGGVGCLALQMLAAKKYKTRAWTRKFETVDWLKEMGATEVENIKDKDFKTTPLASSEWAAAIDNVGGEYLQFILPRIKLWGSVASIGLAQAPLFSTSVFPFILRGVNLLGISSANCPLDLRKTIWQRLASDLKPKNLSSALAAELTLSEVKDYCKKMVDGKTKGRAIVKLRD